MNGFSLLELSVTLFIVSVLSGITITWYGNWLQSARLQSSAEKLVWTLRLAQVSAQVNPHQSMVEFARYDPWYLYFDGLRLDGLTRFEPGVMYHDGYLQMNAGYVSYSLAGNSPMGGTITLSANGNSVPIRLFMGSGLQVIGGSP